MGISLLGQGRWEHFGREMGQILELHYLEVYALFDNITGDPYGPGLQSEQLLALVRDMMQWALPDLLEIEEYYRTVIGKLKAGSS